MLKRLFLSLAILLACAAPAAAQIGSVPFTFTPGTTISSSQVNTNFSTVYGNALNRTGGVMTGTLTSQSVIPSTTNTYNLGDPSHLFANIYLTTLSCSGCVTGSVIANSGVSAGSYGSSSQVPVLTINAQGQVTAASTASIGAPSGLTLTNTYFSSLDAHLLTNIPTSAVSTGNLVATITAGTGITVTGGTGNSSTPSIAITNTAVTPGSSGSATSIPTLTVNAQGQVTTLGSATPQLTLTSTYFSSLSGANLTSLNASNLSSGTVPTARLGSGTASSTTCLFGDQTYKTCNAVFGARVARTPGMDDGGTATVYSTSVDGFLTGDLDATGTSGQTNCTFYADTSNPPTTAQGTYSGGDAPGEHTSPQAVTTVPIRAGENYKIECVHTGAAAATVNAYFTPGG